MPDGIDAPVDGVQPAGGDAAADRRRADAKGQQLPTGDAPVLPRRERRKTVIEVRRVGFFSHSEKKSTRPLDSPPAGHRRGRIGARLRA